MELTISFIVEGCHPKWIQSIHVLQTDQVVHERRVPATRHPLPFVFLGFASGRVLIIGHNL